MDELLSLPDGRTLQIEVAGDRSGAVVLVHHGTPGSRLLFPSHVAEARTKGICLVGYDRPGYGGSTRREARRIADVVDDLRAIAAHLGVERLVTWGISGGRTSWRAPPWRPTWWPPPPRSLRWLPTTQPDWTSSTAWAS